MWGKAVILLTAQICVVLSLWSYDIIGVTARLMGDQGSASHAVLQKSKGILQVCIGVNGLPELAMKFSPSHYCVLPA